MILVTFSTYAKGGTSLFWKIARLEGWLKPPASKLPVFQSSNFLELRDAYMVHIKSEPQTTLANGILALIAARPGRLRDGLRAMLTATPHIVAIDQADEGRAALDLAAQYHPNLVLLDTSLSPSDFKTVLQKLTAETEHPRCLALVDNDRQQLEAKSCGADAVLLKGFSTEMLFSTVENLLIPTK